jgi:hypothetical protein
MVPQPIHCDSDNEGNMFLQNVCAHLQVYTVLTVTAASTSRKATAHILSYTTHFGCAGWRKLHNEELHNLYSSPNIIRMMKTRRMRWAEHVAQLMRRGMHIGYWWEIQKERDH